MEGDGARPRLAAVPKVAPDIQPVADKVLEERRAGALFILDDLREKVERGEVVEFFYIARFDDATFDSGMSGIADLDPFLIEMERCRLDLLLDPDGSLDDEDA